MAPFQEGYTDDLFTHADNGLPDSTGSSSTHHRVETRHRDDEASVGLPIGTDDKPSTPLTPEQIADLDQTTREAYDKFGWPGMEEHDRYMKRLGL